MEHQLEYNFQSEDGTTPWTFKITFEDNLVLIQGIEPERHREIYSATMIVESNRINWDRLPTTPGLRNDKLYPQELRTHVEKLLAMKAFW
jgi:hypothetical protein